MSEATPSAAPTSGLVYGDVPNRAIAYIIDAIVIGLISIVIYGIFGGIIAGTVGSLLAGVVGLAISAAYFVYTWTKMRATLGMKVLGLQIGSAPGGATIDTNQAIRRWLALGAIFSIAQLFTYLLPALSFIVAIAAFAWVIFLIYTTAKSPTKQGWHDVFANTMVVKAAKTVG
jgi:uncharacterized RDD family membrane protein YckC